MPSREHGSPRGFIKADLAQLATLATHNEQLKIPLPLLRLIDEDRNYLHR